MKRSHGKPRLKLKPSNKVNHGVYLVGSKEHGWYKIGVSTNLDGRLKSLSTGVPFPIEKIAYWRVSPYVKAESKERFLHGHFAQKRLNGEWFALTPEDLEECNRLMRYSWLSIPELIAAEQAKDACVPCVPQTQILESPLT